MHNTLISHWIFLILLLEFERKNHKEENMERKSCCGGRSYVSSPCTTQPKKEPVVSPKKEKSVKKETAEDVKGSSTCGAEAAVKSPKVEEKEIASVKKEEKVKVNLGCGGCG
ncbi:hypothetical protein ACB092_03G033200 [Castanea dentata]